jgi:N6-L-threonylcarbamoyladenine synthase
MLVLGIESSCDETAAAVVEDGARVLSDVVSSQVALHARYGGVVPEVASRQHLLQIVPVLEGALAEAEVTLDDIGAIAVTHGPGLMGPLMVGVNTAKALAYARGLPLVGVHHLEGHTYAAWLGGTDPEIDPGFPLIVLIASRTQSLMSSPRKRSWPLSDTTPRASCSAAVCRRTARCGKHVAKRQCR